MRSRGLPKKARPIALAHRRELREAKHAADKLEADRRFQERMREAGFEFDLLEGQWVKIADLEKRRQTRLSILDDYAYWKAEEDAA
jgi:predicted mannosyl-3-phosphoglycerate phosphatase (HAD superfamily)